MLTSTGPATHRYQVAAAGSGAVRVRLCGFVSAMTGQPLSARAQSLPDPVELLGDGSQPFALMVLALLGGRREQDSFLADETLDPGSRATIVPEELQFLGKLRELLGVR
jgi:hypothetical protein